MPSSYVNKISCSYSTILMNKPHFKLWLDTALLFRQYYFSEKNPLLHISFISILIDILIADYFHIAWCYIRDVLSQKWFYLDYLRPVGLREFQIIPSFIIYPMKKMLFFVEKSHRKQCLWENFHVYAKFLFFIPGSR